MHPTSKYLKEQLKREMKYINQNHSQGFSSLLSVID